MHFHRVVFARNDLALGDLNGLLNGCVRVAGVVELLELQGRITVRSEERGKDKWTGDMIFTNLHETVQGIFAVTWGTILSTV